MPCGHSIFGHMNNTATTMVITAQDNGMIDCEIITFYVIVIEWNTLDIQILAYG